MNIDGKQVVHLKNENPLKFENVKVYAGDKYHESANAEIRTFEACQLSQQGMYTVSTKKLHSLYFGHNYLKF